MKLVQGYERSCHCKKKDAVRQVLPNRTAGWQFASDPKTGKVLGAFEHFVHEKNEDKVALLQAVLVMPQVGADLLVHDDACHFEQFVMKNKSAGFDAIKFYFVDTFHMRNHKCEKSTRTRKDKARLKNCAPPPVKFLTHGCCGPIATSFVCRRRASFIMPILKNGHPV